MALLFAGPLTGLPGDIAQAVQTATSGISTLVLPQVFFIALLFLAAILIGGILYYQLHDGSIVPANQAQDAVRHDPEGNGLPDQ